MIALVDTNIIVCQLTQSPPDHGAKATALLRESGALLLADVVVAETVFVLERAIRLPRDRISHILQSLLAQANVLVVDRGVLLRALEIYEFKGLHFAEAYLVATAESTGVGRIASFDRVIDRVPTVRRVESV